MHVPMITVSALVKQSDTEPPRVCSSVAITLLKRKLTGEEDKNQHGKKQREKERKDEENK